MKEITTQELLRHIQLVEAEDMDQVLDAITMRFGQLWPEWELLTLSVPGHTAKVHIEALQKTIEYIKRLDRKNDLP